MNEKSKDKRIKAEIERLSTLFEKAAENQRNIIAPLIQNSAFMRVTLEDLQEIINRDGVIDEYRNGATQYGTKQSATLQSYNALIKNYTTVQKQLLQLLPTDTGRDNLDDFLKKLYEDPNEEAEADGLEEG